MATPLQANRKKDRMHSDRAELDRILDQNMTCVISCVVDGSPWAVPNLYARIGDDVIVHGSTGAGMLRHLKAGAEAVITVHTLHALVLAPKLLNSSANYDGAVVTGTLEVLEGQRKDDALLALTDKILPGRVSELPPPSAADWAQTMVLALPITENNWSARTRDIGVSTPASSDPDAPWQGIIPRHRTWGPAIADEGVTSPEPAAVAHYCPEK